MIKIRLMLAIIWLSIAPDATCIVILIHGSFGSQASWDMPNGDFYDALVNAANILNKKVVPFKWSGKPMLSKIQQAGKHLAEVIKSYPSNEEIILVGYSHGGNVINCATQELAKQKQSTQSSDFYSNFHKHQIATNINLNLDADNSLLYSISPTEKSLYYYLIKRKQKAIPSKKYLIDKVYLLATPIKTAYYKADRTIVDKLYNFYSTGDLVQTIVGTHERHYPSEPNTTNIKTTIHNTGYNKSGNPTHLQMHHPLLAKWILFIPEQLQSCHINGFQHFASKNDCNIHFTLKNFPTYQ